MKLKGLCIGLFICCMISTMNSYAQLKVKNINRISSQQSGFSQSRIAATRDTLTLPFWDDFSFSNIKPDSSLWEFNTGALINGTLGKVSPTINVASFDGNDLNGNPHMVGEGTSIVVDQLTSQPINLSLVAESKRASVYLSFYWQMEGFGEVPESKDSLRLEFKDDQNNWVIIKDFELAGLPENLHEEFTKYAIQIELEKYFHSGFQFQFTAVGNSGGPYDAWHIDYVYLNQDRTIENESIVDRAVASVPTSIFSQYTMIPYDVIFDFPDSIYSDINIEIATLQNNIHPVSYQYILRDTLLNSVLYSIPTTPGPPLANFGRNTVIASAVSAVDLKSAVTDSLYLESEFIFETSDDFFISEINGSDTVFLNDAFYNYKLNDTVRRYHQIHQSLAYDDGQAEYAAGLNKNEAQIAVYFNIPSQDTLTSVDIYFPQFSRLEEEAISPSGKRIVLSVLSDLTGNANSVMRSQEFVIPGGAGLNVLDRFTFDTPLIVSSEFYVAMQQFTNDYIGIGLDNNNLLGKQKIFHKLEEEWKPNLAVEGIIMLRSIFEDSDFVVSAVQNTLENDFKIFPNPAQNVLNIPGKFDRYTLLNLSGASVLIGNANQISVGNLQEGMYFLKIESNQAIYTQKVIIKHE